MIPRENSLFTALGNAILPPFTKKEYFNLDYELRLRVVSHLSSGIVGRAKRERA